MVPYVHVALFHFGGISLSLSLAGLAGFFGIIKFLSLSFQTKESSPTTCCRSVTASDSWMSNEQRERILLHTSELPCESNLVPRSALRARCQPAIHSPQDIFPLTARVHALSGIAAQQCSIPTASRVSTFRRLCRAAVRTSFDQAFKQSP